MHAPSDFAFGAISGIIDLTDTKFCCARLKAVAAGLIFGSVSWQRIGQMAIGHERRLDMTVGLRGDNVVGMKSQSAGQHWFVLLDGKRHGPFTYADLTQAARDGLITADTNIWRPGWQKWHPARRVKGLVSEQGPAAERQSIEQQANEQQANERPLNETPLAPDGTEWADEQVRPPEEESYSFAPQQRRETRRGQEVVALRRDQPAEDRTEHIFADEWRMLAEQPAQDRGRTVVPAARPGRPSAARAEEFDDDADYHRPSVRNEPAGDAGQPAATLVKRVAIGLGATLVLLAGGWAVLGPGGLRPSMTPRSALMSSSGDLPVAVASLPAVMTLQRNDPAAFERFRKRFADLAANGRDDEVMSLARAALRKSVKHLLAISSGDVLLEITETYLAYMQGLQAANPESCVALSDESKGARLTSNLAKELPSVFNREMSVLDRIAGTNPHIGVAPITAEEAQPYLATVYSALRRQPVKGDLLGRERLDPSEFTPYCSLVIAFFQAVLDLPRDDKVNLLRYIYAGAAVNADGDLAK
jgi:GYF domain 2